MTNNQWTSTFAHYVRLLIALLSLTAWCLPAAAQFGFRLSPAEQAAYDAAASAAYKDSTALQAGFSAATTAIKNLNNSGLASQISAARNQFKSYQWRTVYDFSQVSKLPLPGTRLGLLPIPAMSQLDAETYLNTIEFMGGALPALNCPQAPLGGTAGRAMRLSLASGQTVALSDADIRLALVSASPAHGVQVWDIFNELKANVCAAIYSTAQLQFRLDKYHAVQAHWNECASNGVLLSSWSVDDTLRFAGGYTRTVQAGGGILFKCGAVYTGSMSDLLTYDSWFRWSNKADVTQNFNKMIGEAKGTNSNCPSLCVPIVGMAEAAASLCVGVSPNMASITGSTVPMKLGASVNFKSEDKQVCSPVINVPSPFAVAQSLGEMADSARNQALTDMQLQLVGLMPAMTDALNKLSAVVRTFQSIKVLEPLAK